MWFAVLADLHRRCGNDVRAESYRIAALDAAPTAAIKELLQRRLSSRQQRQ
jgi:RNA polymerase sigma-70 factor (ECF subfamily)